MTSDNPLSQRIRLCFVVFSFALSGMAGGLATSVALRSRGIPTFTIAAFISAAIVMVTAHALAAGSLRIRWLGRCGVGFANCLGMIGSLPPFIGTQAMKGNETFADLFVPFAAWFVVAFLVASVIGLSTLHRYGWTVMGLGALGHCVGAAANGALVALNYSHTFSGIPVGLLIYAAFFSLPGILGGTGLAIALNRRLTTTTAAGIPNDHVAVSPT